jgi:hypothetical protein
LRRKAKGGQYEREDQCLNISTSHPIIPVE